VVNSFVWRGQNYAKSTCTADLTRLTQRCLRNWSTASGQQIQSTSSKARRHGAPGAHVAGICGPHIPDPTGPVSPCGPVVPMPSSAYFWLGRWPGLVILARLGGTPDPQRIGPTSVRTGIPPVVSGLCSDAARFGKISDQTCFTLGSPTTYHKQAWQSSCASSRRVQEARSYCLVNDTARFWPLSSQLPLVLAYIHYHTSFPATQYVCIPSKANAAPLGA
jgi:hypothetical protein